MKTWKMQTYWYLGFLALVGVWKAPDVWAYLTAGQGDWTVLINLLWFGWLFNFVPSRVEDGAE